MKLLSVSLARSLWFGHMGDFNPKGITLSSMVSYLAELYKFKKVPPSNADLSNMESVSFENGEFVLNENEAPIYVAFSLYQGGLTGDTRLSTKASDTFLMDLFMRLSTVFNVPPYDAIIRRKRYFSELYVSIEKPFSIINPKLKKVATFLTENTEAGEITFELGGMSFWPEQTAKWIPSPFSIERAAGVPFSENRYFSRAPIETAKHLELLSKLESILS